LDNIPLNYNGKVDYNKLPTPENEINDAGNSQPQTETEQLLQGIIQGVLNQEVGLEDSFVRMGGDSIQAIFVISKARQHGINLTVKDLLEHSIRQIANSVNVNSKPNTNNDADDGPNEEYNRLVPIHHRFMEQIVKHDNSN